MGKRTGKVGSSGAGSEKGRRLKKFSALFTSAAAVIGGVAVLLGNLSSIRNFWSEVSSGDEIQLIVQMATEPYEVFPGEEDFILEDQYQVSYQSHSENGELQIDYTSDYFSEQAKDVGILGSGPYFALPKVGLDLKIVNNSKQAVFLSDAILEVSSSMPDNRPLLAFTHDRSVIDEIEFRNDGWGEPSRIQMFARIQGKDSDPLRELQHRTFLPNPDNGVTVYSFDITPLLEPYGMPVDKIRQALGVMEKEGFDESLALWSQVQPACVRTIGRIDNENPQETRNKTDQELAAFPYDCVVDVEGHVLMTWQDSTQIESSQRMEFKTTVNVTPPDGLGAPAFGPSGSYDIALRAEGKDYIVQSPISQPIEAGKFDRFILWLGAPRSSEHEFVLRVKFNNTGELSSQKIKLQYLMPRVNRMELDANDRYHVE